MTKETINVTKCGNTYYHKIDGKKEKCYVRVGNEIQEKTIFQYVKKPEGTDIIVSINGERVRIPVTNKVGTIKQKDIYQFVKV